MFLRPFARACTFSLRPFSWELASWIWIRQGGTSAQMSRGWPAELARTIYGRRDALAKNADFPVWEKG